MKNAASGNGQPRDDREAPTTVPGERDVGVYAQQEDWRGNLPKPAQTGMLTESG